MFRSNVAEYVTTLLPPLSEQSHTRACQKAWGRKNLALLYEVCNLGGMVQDLHKLPVRREKNSRGALLRQLFAEIHLRRFLFDCEDAGVGFAVMTDGTRVNANTAPVACVLLDIAAALLTYEMVYLMTMQYMQRVWPVVEARSYPSSAVLDQLGFN